MPALYTVQTRTDPGCVREVNEDAVSTVLDWRDRLRLDDLMLQRRGHLFALADGMGGHAAGEIASRLAIRTLFETYYSRELEALSAQERLAHAIAAANEAICREAEKHPERAGLGTTLVAAVLRGDELIIANVGDSRAYWFHDHALRQITRDHSWVAEQVAAEVISAEEATRHPYRNVITRSLGPERNPEPDFFRQTVHFGDRLLLCSDGLSNMVKPAEMAQLLDAYATDEAADRLLQLACERGAPDNVTLALVEFLIAAPSKKRKTRFLAVLSLLVLLLAALLVREFIATMPARPTATPLRETPITEAAARFTPVTPPGATIEPPLADPVRVGVIRRPAPSDDSILPATEDYLYFVRGPVAIIEKSSSGWRLALPQKSRTNAAFRYTMTLHQGWQPNAARPEVGDVVGVIARPTNESDLSDDIGLEPLLLLETDPPLGANAIVWSNAAYADMWRSQEEYWLYSVYGLGGGDALGLNTPPGQEGQPIALRALLFIEPSRSNILNIRPADEIFEWSDAENAYLPAASPPSNPPLSPSPFLSPP
ncbi:MAG: Stp1/IreP family PP2C-type Ser/Thr phosphatase [Chloroflexi bacterium]|nr:Stp1/IreP family PP2C-type Ser/Thr phosphatase [Chloroflexota bacterium]